MQFTSDMPHRDSCDVHHLRNQRCVHVPVACTMHTVYVVATGRFLFRNGSVCHSTTAVATRCGESAESVWSVLESRSMWESPRRHVRGVFGVTHVLLPIGRRRHAVHPWEVLCWTLRVKVCNGTPDRTCRAYLCGRPMRSLSVRHDQRSVQHISASAVFCVSHALEFTINC